MKLIKRIIPHLTISFSLATFVVAIVNMFNPRMGFLDSSQGLILTGITLFLSIASALIAITGSSADAASNTSQKPAAKAGKHVK